MWLRNIAELAYEIYRAIHVYTCTCTFMFVGATFELCESKKESLLTDLDDVGEHGVERGDKDDPLLSEK